MLISQSRPRVLGWYHAGPLLFGDWGTSRLYVLGLAFYYSAHASVLYQAVMSLIMVVVAWAYTVICRCYPEGGGVYAAARQISPTLSVIGATLLICDYVVTAALSMVEGLRYFGMPPGGGLVAWCVVCIAVIGLINWFGARSAGRFALVVAIAAIGVSALIAILCIPMLGEGLSRVSTGDPAISSPWTRWESLVRIILALSGVEAVANMTGLMKEPVARTAKRTIWPVLAEVVVLNMIFAIALNALPAIANVGTPDYVVHEVRQGLASEHIPEAVQDYRDKAMKLLAFHAATQAFGAAVGKVVGWTAAIVFGLLLISAVNTAIMALVSVKYALAQDKEIPPTLAKLNYSGVPWIPLLIACVLPAAMLVFVGSDVKLLSELYAIGVVGAIAINVLCCGFNAALPISTAERWGLRALGIFMTLVEATIVYAKPHAAYFAGGMIVAVLIVRSIVRARAGRAAALAPPPSEIDWLAEVRRQPMQLDPNKRRIMLAARGRDQAEFAIDLARRKNATLFAIYVRTLRVMDMRPGSVPRIEEDRDAQESLGTAAVLARQYNVPFIPIYVSSPAIAEEILDYTVTYGCDTLIMGKSKRRLFARRLEGDVITEVARHLPDGVALITREAGSHSAAPLIPSTPPAAPLAASAPNAAPPPTRRPPQDPPPSLP